MSASNVDPPAKPVIPPKVSGVRTVLRYTGIPPSWLDKRPKLPSRNWLIFLSVTSSVVGYYVYDRRECKRIRQEYVDKVKDLSEEQVGTLAWPRRVTVYGAKWPGDEDFDQSLKYFRKYVKPILVAGAVDYNVVAGKRHGDIANRVAEDVRIRRRFDVGLDVDTPMTKALPTYKSLAERRQLELDGGIVIIGRPTFKEFMAGLKRGWTDSLQKIDKDELLARELEEDNYFDEPPEEPNAYDNESTSEAAKASKFPSPGSSPLFSPLSMRPSNPPPKAPRQPTSIPDDVNAPPGVIPPIPPLLLVSFTNYIGLKLIPLMMWDFFNQRTKVQAGAEAGYRLVMKATRPFDVPATSDEPLFSDITPSSEQPHTSDLDFDKEAESYIKKSLNSFPDEIEKTRRKYYEALPAKLVTARALARGTREPTKDELSNPPPTEVELRAERMKKETRWRNDLAGWEIVKPDAKVAWDERFRNALQVFTDPPESETKVDSNPH